MPESAVCRNVSIFLRSRIHRLVHQGTPHVVVLLLITALAMQSCGTNTLQRKVARPDEIQLLDAEARYLKLHMHNGHVYVLEQWSVDSIAATLSGTGVELDVQRDTVATDQFSVPLDSVAILETNVSRPSGAIAALGIFTAASVALTVYCLSNPKACFGSCPTFYASDRRQPMLQAEGFSASVAPSLEATDIDALYRTTPEGRTVEIEMRNEALETHVVRHADLLVVERPPGRRIFVTPDGVFRRATQITGLSRGRDAQGECTDALMHFDGIERFSKADSSYLATRETVHVAFDVVPDGEVGLVVASRQSLMSTYLFYQTLAYMGSTVGEWFAALERNAASHLSGVATLGQQLGWIDIWVQREDGNWTYVGHVGETGPLATNVHFLELPESRTKPRRIQLRMCRGFWRLDYLALVALEEEVTPVRIRPFDVWRGETRHSAARDLLLDSMGQLCTFPGDRYTLRYRLPEDDRDCELFLESRGYYLEWIRKEWLAEEDPVAALMVFTDPQGTLRRLAPEYKRVEPELEEMFWSSRYAR
jgi:hypothetical protein